MVGKKRGRTTKEWAKKVKKTDVIEVGESDEDETGRVKAVEGLGLSRKLLCPPPPKQGRLLPQGHSGFRDFRMPRAREESNPAPSQTKPSLPHSPTTTLIHFIRHCFHLQRSYTSLTYIVYVVLTFFVISDWIFTGVNAWLKLQIQLVAAIKGLNRSRLSYNKKYKSILADYKNNKMANGVSCANRYQECR